VDGAKMRRQDERHRGSASAASACSVAQSDKS
jgi:hypothetical protein